MAFLYNINMKKEVKIKQIANKLNKNILKAKKYQGKKSQEFHHFLLDRFDEEYINQNEVFQEIGTLFADNENDMYELIETVEELNKELEVKTKESQQITEEYIKAIKAKPYISPKEFSILYGMSIGTQDDRRGRTHNPLPYKKQGVRLIVYNQEEAREWYESELN